MQYFSVTTLKYLTSYIIMMLETTWNFIGWFLDWKVLNSNEGVHFYLVHIISITLLSLKWNVWLWKMLFRELPVGEISVSEVVYLWNCSSGKYLCRVVCWEIVLQGKLVFDQYHFDSTLDSKEISKSINSIMQQCLWRQHTFWYLWISRKHKNLDIYLKNKTLFFSSNKKTF